MCLNHHILKWPQVQMGQSITYILSSIWMKLYTSPPRQQIQYGNSGVLLQLLENLGSGFTLALVQFRTWTPLRDMVHKDRVGMKERLDNLAQRYG
jgi:hypothetical protein